MMMMIIDFSQLVHMAPLCGSWMSVCFLNAPKAWTEVPATFIQKATA